MAADTKPPASNSVAFTRFIAVLSVLIALGLCPDFADTSKKADTGPGGVS
jgi:hypothetical protein